MGPPREKFRGGIGVRGPCAGSCVSGGADANWWFGWLRSGAGRVHVGVGQVRSASTQVNSLPLSQGRLFLYSRSMRPSSEFPGEAHCNDARRELLQRGIGRRVLANESYVSDFAVYFCDPQSPWQRGTNENTNGLLRQYFPKGTDLSTFTQAKLNAIALRMNTRPRKTLGFMTPAEKLASSVAITG